jgi:hypothetical protein
MASPSGRFLLRAGPELHQRLNQEARKAGTSLNATCVRLIREALDERFALPGAFAGLVESILNVYNDIPILALVLFGSVARREDREGSDTDILVVTDATCAITRDLYRAWENHANHLESMSAPLAPRPVALHFAHFPRDLDRAGSLWLEVALEGQALCDPHHHFAAVQRELRLRIAAGQYVRKTTHGHPYWVREKTAC